MIILLAIKHSSYIIYSFQIINSSGCYKLNILSTFVDQSFAFGKNEARKHFEITLNNNEVLSVTAEGKTEGIIIFKHITPFEIEFHHFDLRKHSDNLLTYFGSC